MAEDAAAVHRLTRSESHLGVDIEVVHYAADEAVKTVVGCGISRVLVRASGDIAVADPPPGERGWRIGIAPLNPDEKPTRFVLLAHGGVSTSGDARQHLVAN